MPSLTTHPHECKFKVGDKVVFQHNVTNNLLIIGTVEEIHQERRYSIDVKFPSIALIHNFTHDGYFYIKDKAPSLQLASPNPTWTVILLYPDYMTDDFGADIYVESAEADDPYEAVKIVQEMAVDANSDTECSGDKDPDDFRCIGVIKGEHSFVLDAMSF